MKHLALILCVLFPFHSHASFKLDRSLSDSQTETFKHDMKMLTSLEANNNDTHLKLQLGVFNLNGENLFKWLSQNIIAVANEGFSPVLCLQNGTNISSEPGLESHKKALSLVEKFKERRIPPCTNQLMPGNFARLKGLPSSRNNAGISYTMSGYEFFNDLGLKGGLFFSGGNFLPQDSPKNRILVLQENISTSHLTNSIAPVSENIAHYVRIADYFGEAIGSKSYEKCSIRDFPVFTCENSKNSGYSIRGRLLELFANSCKECTEEEKATLHFMAANSLSFIKGSIPDSLFGKSIIETNKELFAKHSLDPRITFSRTARLMTQ